MTEYFHPDVWRRRFVGDHDVERMPCKFAEQCFGAVFTAGLKGRPASGRPLPLNVGVANAVPKLIVLRLLQPAMCGDPAIRLNLHRF